MAGPTRYRQLQSPVGVDVLNTDTGGTQAAQALSDAFSNFANVGTHLIGENRALQGLAEGEAAGTAGTPQPRHGFRANTTYGRSYNSAAEAAYSAKVATDIDSSFGQMEQDNEANLGNYEMHAREYAEGLLSEAPAEYRPIVQRALAARSAAGFERVRGQQIAFEREGRLADWAKGTDAKASLAITSAEFLSPEEGDKVLLASAADYDAGLQALVDNHDMHPVDAVKWSAAFKDSLDKGLFNARTDHTVDKLIAQAGADVIKGDRALMAYLDDPKNSDEDKAAVREKYDARRTALAEDRSRVLAPRMINLAKRIAAGEAGQDVLNEAEALYRKGGSSDAEWRSNVSAIINNGKVKIEDAADTTAVMASLRGLGGLDPTNGAQKKALNKVVDQAVIAAGMVRGDERWTASMIDVIKKTNILPDQAEAYARVQMLSQDPYKAALGAAFFARVHDAKAEAWDYAVDKTIQPFAEQMNGNLAAGLDPATAYQMAHANVYDMKKEQKDILRLEYSANPKNLAENASQLQSDLDSDDHFDRSAFSNSPDAALAMKGEYNSLVGQYYVSTNGNLKLARTMASSAVRSRYGVTEVNGVREIAKYPMERMYPGLTPEFVRDNLKDKLEAAGHGDLIVTPSVEEAPVADPMSPASIGAAQRYADKIAREGQPAAPKPALAPSVRLAWNANTDRSRGLEWTVTVRNADGFDEPLLDKNTNMPVLYKLPVGQEFAAARAEAEKGELAKAIATREAYSKRREIYADIDRYEYEGLR